MIKSKWGLPLILVVALTATGCTGEEPATAPQVAEAEAPTPVQISPAIEDSIASGAGYTGKLAPSQEVKLSPKVPGKIQTLSVKLGQYVQKGSVLFTLDQDDLRNAVRQAEAQYQVSVAGLSQSGTSTTQSVETAKNAMAQAERAYQDAKREATRSQELFNQGALSQQQNEQAQAALKNAETAFNNAKVDYNSASKKTGIVVSEANVNQARVALASAREQLSNSTVTAPISGYVSQIGGHVGEMATGQAPVVVLVNTNPLLVKANLSEDEITKIKVGDRTTVELTALNKKIEATITAVSPTMDQQLKAYPIEITVPNPKNELKADMVVNLKIQSASSKVQKAVAIPRKAVFDENGKKYIYKVEGDIAKKVAVETGEESSELIEIKKGVSLGEKVVIRGQSMLKDGGKVEIQKMD
ncbi:efflux RND transporter periplasmic adaptor subunit [Brevibacillus laterosporus]|uniref:efflux RND transporter periplasmic adaptor subunit n=1 Tax=Brevibacillus laterosporus TaxID=1465 RepID=UPI003D1F139E